MNAPLVKLMLASTIACSLLFTACCCLTPWIHNVELSQHTATEAYRGQENSKPGDRKVLHRDRESLPRKARQDVSLSYPSTRK